MVKMRARTGATIWDPEGRWSYINLRKGERVFCAKPKPGQLAVPARVRHRAKSIRGMVACEDLEEDSRGGNPIGPD